MHRNAPLTPEGRFRLCLLIEDGWTVAAAAESMRISRQTAHKWWSRYQQAGRAGLDDRSSRPRRCPTKTPDKVERRLVELRRRHQLGPARLAPRAGVPASTLHAVSGPPRRVSALRSRASGRSSGPPDRDLSPWRARPHRHQEAGQDPQRRWLARQRHQGQEPQERQGRSSPPRLCLRPFGHRRPLPPGVLGDPCQRTGRHRGGLLEAGSGLLRHLRHHRRKSDDRQRPLLSLGRLYRRAGRRRHRPHSDQGVLPADQWENSSATTGPCSTSGHTPGPIAQRPPEPEPWTPGSTCTTITGTTPPSGAHRSAESTTWLDPTPRRSGLGEQAAASHGLVSTTTDLRQKVPADLRSGRGLAVERHLLGHWLRRQ